MRLHTDKLRGIIKNGEPINICNNFGYARFYDRKRTMEMDWDEYEAQNKKINDTDLRDLLINPKLNRRGQYICDCPFCGKEQHFYISKETQAFDCKKCGEYGSIYKLLKQLDKTYLLGGATIEVRETINSLRSMLEDELEGDEVELKELPVIRMPAGWKVSVASTEYLKKSWNNF